MNYSSRNYEIRPIEAFRIDEYLHLFRENFPRYRRSHTYLNWLYFQNPRGRVIGFDALINGAVVSHYACVPIMIQGRENLSLLSVNTVTDRDHIGRGLFTQLAEQTYEFASDCGFEEVVGVANANSIDGFTRKLQFSNLGNLNLRFGHFSRSGMNTRQFSADEVRWLSKQPDRDINLQQIVDGVYRLRTFFPRRPLRLSNLCFTDFVENLEPIYFYGFTVDWNLRPAKTLSLPDIFKPSPLHLIYKRLGNRPPLRLESWSYLDFDLT